MNNPLPLNRSLSVRWFLWWIAAEAAGVAVSLSAFLSGRHVAAKETSQDEEPVRSDALIDLSLATHQPSLLLKPLALAGLAAYVLGIGLGLALRIIIL